MQAFFEFHEDWSQFFRGCNWRTFDLCKFQIEDDRMMGAWEVTMKVLGIGFRFRHIYTVTDTARRIASQVSDLELKD